MVPNLWESKARIIVTFGIIIYRTFLDLLKKLLVILNTISFIIWSDTWKPSKFLALGTNNSSDNYSDFNNYNRKVIISRNCTHAWQLQVCVHSRRKHVCQSPSESCYASLWNSEGIVNFAKNFVRKKNDSLGYWF